MQMAKMTVAACSECSTRFWISAFVSSFLVLVWCSPAVIGSDRGRAAARCPADLAGETRLCLTDYTSQLDALSDNRFFPGLDVEVIRSLCSLLDDSMRCVRNTLIENCPKSEQQQAIEDELGPHLGVRQLCLHTNIYEDYAMNQNCFGRIRPDGEICYRNFMVAVQDDDEPDERQSASLSSSSQRHQAPQQRQYCNHVKRLIACVKNLVRTSTTSCQKMALRLVDVLVRASLPSTVYCRDEPNPTAAPAQGKASDRHQDVNSSGRSLQRSGGGLLLNVCCFALAGVVCLQSFLLHVLGPAASLLLFHRSTPPTTTPLPLSPPSPFLQRRHLHHHRFVDLLFS